MARRRYQKGSLMQRGEVWIGRWREDVILPDGTHKRLRKSAIVGKTSELTKRLAQRELDKLTENVNSATYRPIPVCTLRQFAERWQAAILPNYKPSTQSTMRYHLGTHILPGLGDRQLNSINLEAVQTWVTNLHLAPASTARVITTLKAVWNTAKEWGYVSHDLKGKLRLPATSRRDARPTLKVEEVKTLLGTADEPLRTILRTAFETGLRIGEVLGLTAADVESDRRVLWVRQSVWHSQIQSPKTESSERALAISDGLSAALAGREGLLFHTRSGRPYSQRNVLREWHKLLKRTGLPKCGFHSLRHGNASWMARNGVPIRIAQERLGHADPRLTLKIYQHVQVEDGRAAAQSLGFILDSPPNDGKIIAPKGVNSSETPKVLDPYWTQTGERAS